MSKPEITRFPGPPPSSGRLREDITSCLTEYGWSAWTPNGSALTPLFIVTEGIGATVTLSWEAADPERRGELIAMAEILRSHDFAVQVRSGDLYVTR